MSESQISLALYDHLCEHIVGSEEVVKTRRLVLMAKDRMGSNENFTIITSGSIGEGLDLKGSDLDIMYVLKQLSVQENKHSFKSPTPATFEIDTENTRPGLVRLKQLEVHPTQENENQILSVKINGNWYLSSQRWKNAFLGFYCRIDEIHGPCVSDKDELYDFAICFHCLSWINMAKQWIKREHKSWPSSTVKSQVIAHGVLFVPIGSNEDDLEWRTSFSVAEKLLIYSFNHTQLLCYALMKILLKDIICSDKRIEDVLCSYFIKTIIFWLSEELPFSVWRPNNIVYCFMTCIERLIYCVEYGMCPNYFIPEINMFENKVVGLALDILLRNLKLLYRMGWKCLLFSEQFNNFENCIAKFSSSNKNRVSFGVNVNNIRLLLNTVTKIGLVGDVELPIVLQKVCNSSSSSIRRVYLFAFSNCRFEDDDAMDSNKEMYRTTKIYMICLILHLCQDAVSGWLRIADFFYRNKRYENALKIISYSLSKCTPEMLLPWYPHLSAAVERKLLAFLASNDMSVLRLLKILTINDVRVPVRYLPFNQAPAILLKDKDCVFSIPPVVYAHFICFLCHYSLNDRGQCLHSLRDLELTISEKYFIEQSDFSNAVSHYCLGLAYQLVSDQRSAQSAFSVVSRLGFQHFL